MVNDQVSLALLRDLFDHMKTAHDKKDMIDVPLLILAGTEDKITPLEGAERFIDELGTEDKKLRKFEGAYHEIFNDPEWKDEFHDEIIEWIETYS
ncbi:MAG: serine aminopeptidase domain-containing protein [Thermoplasmata archaeon]